MPKDNNNSQNNNNVDINNNENINDNGDVSENNVVENDNSVNNMNMVYKVDNVIQEEIEDEEIEEPAQDQVLYPKLKAIREKQFNEKVGAIEQSIVNEKAALATENEKDNNARQLRDNKNLKTQHQLAINKLNGDNIKIGNELTNMENQVSQIEAELANLTGENADPQNEQNNNQVANGEQGNQNVQITDEKKLQEYLKVTALKNELATLRENIDKTKLRQKENEQSIKASQEQIEIATKNIENLEKSLADENERENNIKALEDQLKNLQDNKENIIKTGEGLPEISNDLIEEMNDEQEIKEADENVENKEEDVFDPNTVDEPQNDAESNDFRKNYRYNEEEILAAAEKLFEEAFSEGKNAPQDQKNDNTGSEAEENQRPYGLRNKEEQQKNYVNLDNVNWNVDEEKPYDPNATDEAEKPYDPNAIDEAEKPYDPNAVDEPQNDAESNDFRKNYRYNEKEILAAAEKLFEEAFPEEKNALQDQKNDNTGSEAEENQRPYGLRNKEEQQKNYVNLDNVNWNVDEEKPYDPNAVDDSEQEPQQDVSLKMTHTFDEKKILEDGEKILRDAFGDDFGNQDEAPKEQEDAVQNDPDEVEERRIYGEFADEKAIHELAQRLVREKRGADEQKAMEEINGGSLEGHNPRNFDTIEQIKSEIPEDAYEGIYSMFAENTQPDDSAHAALFADKLATFNKMYKTQIDANKFVTSVNDAFEKMKSADEKEREQGKQTLSNVFKDTLKKAFDAEKVISYDERRLPDYSEIVKSTNDLMRASMFAFTDLYRDPKSETLFEPTAFGGLNADDMAELTKGDDTMWKMDQKSDEAWQYQSQDAKDLADRWLQDDKPYEKMINEMNALAEVYKNGTISRKDMYDKLAAAEWMLLNNEKMMVEDPEDPLNPIPNWGTRYWKSITNAREALGIDQHTSMRELIQGEYAAIAKAVNSVQYNKTQIDTKVLNADVREKVDSLSDQKKTFEIQKRAASLNSKKEEKELDNLEMTENRVRISVPSENERENMKNETKEYNFIVDKSAELEITRTQDDVKL